MMKGYLEIIIISTDRHGGETSNVHTQIIEFKDYSEYEVFEHKMNAYESVQNTTIYRHLVPFA